MVNAAGLMLLELWRNRQDIVSEGWPRAFIPAPLRENRFGGFARYCLNLFYVVQSVGSKMFFL